MSQPTPTFYPVWATRVARKEGELPHPVEIRLPKTDGLLKDEERVPGTIYGDDFCPKPPIITLR
jgi:hypothetical protein